MFEVCELLILTRAGTTFFNSFSQTNMKTVRPISLISPISPMQYFYKPDLAGYQGNILNADFQYTMPVL